MEIPEEIKKIANSKELFDTVEKIALPFGLNIDQTGELDAEIRSVLLGIHNPKDFTANISKLLEIDNEIANKITNEVNLKVFQTIKSQVKLNEQITDTTNQISSLEKVGGFNIEKSEGQSVNEDTAPEIEEKSDVTEADRESILYGIENPVRSKSTTTVPQPENTHTDPLIDHLLSNPVSTSEKKVEHIEAKPENTKPKGADPYREPIN